MFIFDPKRAVQLRRELAAKLNREVTQEEVAHEASTYLCRKGEKSISVQVIRRMESQTPQCIDVATLNALAAFYRNHGLDVRTLIRYIEEDEDLPKKIEPHYAPA